MEGKDVVFVSGHIVSIETEKELIYTVFDPNAGWEDIPENYVEVSFTLSETNGQTLLTVIQGDYADVVDGQKRYEDTLKGWPSVLEAIKKVVEA
jgi:hypothetical protein